MNWDDWYQKYDTLPDLQARLGIVRREIVSALNECPAGPIRILSICAGDGRDLIGALRDHPRRADVAAFLLDNHEPSIARGKAAAIEVGLEKQLQFIHADAGAAANYAERVPADLVIVSGILGHLRHEDVANLVANLPMLCKRNGCVIWSRHCVMNQGRDQVPVIREHFRRLNFKESSFESTGPDGFAVGRFRSESPTTPLDPGRVLFEYVGIDRLMPAYAKLDERGSKIPGGDTSEAVASELCVEAEQSIAARFEQMASVHSLRTAVASGASRLTYSELNAAGNRLAHFILSRGGEPGDRVALLLRHDAPLVIAALAVLKAGRVVVVLNGTDPSAHLKKIVSDAEPRLIIADAANHELAALIAESRCEVIRFDGNVEGPADSPGIRVAPGDIAWLIYTSGSSGQPKAVMQSHRNILHNVLRLSRGLQLVAEDRILMLGSPSGGQGVGTIWCALLNGAMLCPFPVAEKGFTALEEWIGGIGITIFIASTSVFRGFIKTVENRRKFPSVRTIRLASEPASSDDFASYRQHFGDDCILFETFSSSETGNVTQCRLTVNDRVADGRLPLGRPVDGMEVLLADENGEPVRNGETGEIVVRSRYLSPGYWRNSALTAERFSGGEGPHDVRLYRSGDLARRLPDGNLMFVSRKDSRIKVHGFRVEISEIEEALLRQPEIENVVVSVGESPANDAQLAAYVVLRRGRKCDAETLRHRLRSLLPAYMVPGRFIFLDAFPLTPHGKINRQALPRFETKPPASRPSAKPRDIVERTLARMWESVLGISSVGRRDDFFDLGGSSLQAIELVGNIEEFFSVALPPSALVEHSTIEQLASALSDHAVIRSARCVVPLRSSGNGARPLFLIHSGQGDVVTYGLLVRRLKERPIYGLQAVGLQGESWPLTDVRAMAARYLPEIIAADPTGPYLLAGTCMGGMVAFELAHQLVKSGRQVNLLALMDSPTPPYSGRRLPWHEALTDPLRDILRMLRWIPVRTGGVKPRADQLAAYRHFVAAMAARAFRRYRPPFYPGTITLVQTAETKYRMNDRRPLIARYARDARKVSIPGTRTGLFARPAVDELARQLQACLDQAGASEPTDADCSSRREEALIAPSAQ